MRGSERENSPYKRYEITVIVCNKVQIALPCGRCERKERKKNNDGAYNIQTIIRMRIVFSLPCTNILLMSAIVLLFAALFSNYSLSFVSIVGSHTLLFVCKRLTQTVSHCCRRSSFFVLFIALAFTLCLSNEFAMSTLRVRARVYCNLSRNYIFAEIELDFDCNSVEFASKQKHSFWLNG